MEVINVLDFLVTYYLLGVFLNSFFLILAIIIFYNEEDDSHWKIKDSFMMIFTVLSSFLTPIAAIFATWETIREIKAEKGIDYES